MNDDPAVGPIFQKHKARVLLSPTYEAAQCLGCSQIDHKLKYSRLLADLWASLNPALWWGHHHRR